MNSRLKVGFAAMAAFALACSDATSPLPVPASLTISPDSPFVLVDSTSQLSVTVRDKNGNALGDPTLAWLVFDTTVAQVSAEGVLSGKSLGNSSLVVASGNAFLQVPIRTVTPIVNLSAGFQGACSLTPRSTVYCWGPNFITPTPVPGAHHFQSVGVGDQDACGLDTGVAYCWIIDSGSTPSTITPISTPVAVGGPSFTSLSAGYLYKCGLTSVGAAYCWQNVTDNTGEFSSFSAPAVLPGLTFTSLSSTYSACGITSSGPVYCWGPNYYGALGNHANGGPCKYYTKPCSSTPVQVDSSLPSVTTVAAGWYHTCALTAAGDTYCWGDNSSGELGDTVIGSGCWFRQLHTDSLYPCSEKPIPVRTTLHFTALTLGVDFTCGLIANGAAYCWGDNSLGQFGDGTTTSSPVPVPAAGGLHFQSLAAGHEWTCGVGQDGIAYCWGSNGFTNLLLNGQAGGTTITTPTRIPYQP